MTKQTKTKYITKDGSAFNAGTLVLGDRVILATGKAGTIVAVFPDGAYNVEIDGYNGGAVYAKTDALTLTGEARVDFTPPPAAPKPRDPYLVRREAKMATVRSSAAAKAWATRRAKAVAA